MSSPFTISSLGRPEDPRDDGAHENAGPNCVAVVPIAPTIHWARVPDRQMSRADFVTQLIATAEHAPQTRSLRRAAPADAQAAYGARQVRGASGRTRQII
jgi:hypothetical protein